MNYLMKKNKKHSFAKFRKDIANAIAADLDMTDILVVTKHGYSYAEDTISFICASEVSKEADSSYCIDECKSMLQVALMDNVELRDIVFDAVDLYRNDHCPDDDIELECYIKGRMDVWEEYCKDDQYDWKAALAKAPQPPELPAGMREKIEAEIAQKVKSKK